MLCGAGRARQTRGSDAEDGPRARTHRPSGRLFHREEALSEYRLLLGHHLESPRLPDRHVYCPFCPRPHRRLGRSMAGNDRGSRTKDRTAASNLYGTPPPGLYSAGEARLTGGETMHPGEAKPFRVPRVCAANDNRPPLAVWRRAAAAPVAAAFALMLARLGFHPY